MKKSLKVRLLVFFGAILLVFGFSNLWAIINFNALSESIANIMESNYRSIEAAQNMMVAIERQDSATLSYMFSEKEQAKTIFYQNQKTFFNWLTRAQDNITEEGEAEILKQINQSYDQYIRQYADFLMIDTSNDLNQLNDYYYQQLFTSFQSTIQNCRELLMLNQSSMLKKRDAAQATARRAAISTAVVSGAAVLIGILIVMILSNRIIKPINRLIIKIKEISNGHYDQRIEITGQDEISKLAFEFNTMAERLVDYNKQNMIRLLQEKNKSEAIVASIGDGIIVTDNKNNIILVNHRAEIIFDIRESEALDRHILETINNQTLFSLFKGINAQPYESQIKKSAEITIENEQALTYYNVTIRPVRLSGKEHFGAVALIRDITNFKELDRMKSDFIATISHEFRTPLTSITMGVGLLLEKESGILNSKQSELVQTIQEDSERLNRLVNELLDLSKLESGRMQMNFGAHQLSEAAQYAIRVFKLQFEEINAKLSLAFPEPMRDAKMDLNKITWVLSNLIGNAVRYLPNDGSGMVEIGAKEIYGKIIVSVKDNGSGIDESIKDHIFDKFIQGDGKTGIAGLGLAICKEIVKAHGGDIWFESKKNQGTTFFFSVPLMEPQIDRV